MKKLAKILSVVLAVALLMTSVVSVLASAATVVASIKIGKTTKTYPTVLAGVEAVTDPASTNKIGQYALTLTADTDFGPAENENKVITIPADTVLRLDLGGKQLKMNGYSFKVEGGLVVSGTKTGSTLTAEDVPFVTLATENAFFYCGSYVYNAKTKTVDRSNNYLDFLTLNVEMLVDTEAGVKNAVVDIYGANVNKTKTVFDTDHGMLIAASESGLKVTAESSAFTMKAHKGAELSKGLFGAAYDECGTATMDFVDCAFVNESGEDLYLFGAYATGIAPTVKASVTGESSIADFIVADDCFYTRTLLGEGVKWNSTVNLNTDTLVFTDGDVVFDAGCCVVANDGADADTFPYVVGKKSEGGDDDDDDDDPGEGPGTGAILTVNGKEYTDLASAVLAIVGDVKIVFLADVTIDTTLTLSDGASVDLNGHTVTANVGTLFVSSSTLTRIYSSKPGGKIEATGKTVVSGKNGSVTYGDGTNNLTVVAGVFNSSDGGNYSLTETVIKGGTFICTGYLGENRYPCSMFFTSVSFGGSVKLTATGATFRLMSGASNEHGLTATGANGTSTVTLTDCVLEGDYGTNISTGHNSGSNVNSVSNVVLSGCKIGSKWSLVPSSTLEVNTHITLLGGCEFDDIGRGVLGEDVKLMEREDPAAGESKYYTVAKTTLTWNFPDGTVLTGTYEAGEYPVIAKAVGCYYLYYEGDELVTSGMTEVTSYHLVEGRVTANFRVSMTICDGFTMKVLVPTDGFILLNNEYKRNHTLVTVDDVEYAVLTFEVTPDDITHEYEISVESDLLWDAVGYEDAYVFTVSPLDYLKALTEGAMGGVAEAFTKYALYATYNRVLAEMEGKEAGAELDALTEEKTNLEALIIEFNVNVAEAEKKALEEEKAALDAALEAAKTAVTEKTTAYYTASGEANTAKTAADNAKETLDNATKALTDNQDPEQADALQAAVETAQAAYDSLAADLTAKEAAKESALAEKTAAETAQTEAQNAVDAKALELQAVEELIALYQAGEDDIALPAFDENTVKTVSGLTVIKGAALDLDATPGFVFYVAGDFTGTLTVSFTDVNGETQTLTVSAFEEIEIAETPYKYFVLRLPAYDLLSDITVKVDGTEETLVYNLATYLTGRVGTEQTANDLLLISFYNFVKSVEDYFKAALAK